MIQCRHCGVKLTVENSYRLKYNDHICNTCQNKIIMKYRRKAIVETTKYVRTVFCPKCGKKGKLKLRTHLNKNTGYTFKFYQVDHYRGSTYLYSCYLGKVKDNANH